MTPAAADSSLIPDRLSFASDALSLAGALVEPASVGALALLPEGLALDLELPEVARLVLGAKSSSTLTELPGEQDLGAKATEIVNVDFGSRLLERLVERALGGTPVAAAAKCEDDPPRPAQARSLAERFVVRNGVYEIDTVLLGSAVYASVWVAWTAEGDERHEGLVQCVLSERDHGEPERQLAARWTPVQSERLRAVALDPPEPSDMLARRLATLAGGHTGAALAPLAEAAARRHRRDHGRLIHYFEELGREAVAAARKRRVEPAALAEKLDHFAAERDAKLAELSERFRLRVQATPLAALRVLVPVARVQLRLRRRKGERFLTLMLPAGASSFDRLACDGCHASVGSITLCDDRLHVLCEACAPSAQGRVRCPACQSDERTSPPNGKSR